MPSTYICEAEKRFYQDSVDSLRNIFNRLSLIMDGEAAIHIKDMEVLQICLRIWDENKDGYITEKEASVQRNISFSTFSQNTKITTFDEFKYFNFYSSAKSLFYGCTSLKSIELPETEIVRYQHFYECTSLERCIIGSGCPTIEKQAFINCGALKRISIPDTVTSIGDGAFYGTGLSNFVYPDGVSYIKGLSTMPNLTYVEIGEYVTNVAEIRACPSMETLIIRTDTPPATEYSTLRDSRIPNIYVPDTSVDAYKISIDWNKWATKIYPLSTYKEDY